MKLAKCDYLLNWFANIISIAFMSLNNNSILAQTVSNQIIPDNTLGNEKSIVNHSIDAKEQTINGGAVRGSNLFHSFQEFNVNEGKTVNFANPDGVTNILSRVTGLRSSQILGKLGVIGGDANLFLINPNGIAFGEKASLNVNGSFVATTANSINFTNGYRFSASSTDKPPLLTINVPVGLQFKENPKPIINQAQSPQIPEFKNQQNTNEQPAGLLVPADLTLAIIGGSVVFEGGNLTTEGGNIEVGSVGSNSLVNFEILKSSIDFNYSLVENFLDITLTNRDGFINLESGEIINSPVASTLDASSSNSTIGSVNLQGNNINILNGSQLLTTTQVETSGGNITINAKEQLTIGGNNFFLNQFPVSSSLLSSTVGTGNAGNIKISAKNIFIRDFATVGSNSAKIIINSDEPTKEVISQTGNGGNINITALSLNLNNSGIVVTTDRSDGGNITLDIDNNIELRDRSSISASVGGKGNGGNITIDTEFIISSPQDNSDIIATAEEGNGGRIIINASGIIGIDFQDRETDFSDITASSDFGTDGTVTLINSDIQSDTTDTNNEVEFVRDVPQFISSSCYANSRKNQYIRVGRGGLPLASTNSLISEHTWEDWRIIEAENKEKTAVNSAIENQNIKTRNQAIAITPIQGWLVDEKGRIVLTADPITVTPHSSENKYSGC